MKTPKTVILSDLTIAALDEQESFLSQLEAKQDNCKHDQPLIPAQSGNTVCLLCWKSWEPLPVCTPITPTPVSAV